MRNLLRWLYRTDARRVFLANAALLPCVLVFWAWKSFAPITDQASSPAGSARSETDGNLSVLDFLEHQTSAPPVRLTCNPFRGPAPAATRNQSYVFDRTNTIRRADTNRSQRLVGSQSQGSDPFIQPPPPQRETVKITYRGMFERTDGKIVALVEDSKSNRSVFYSSGESFLDFKITSVQEDTLNVMLKDGSEVSLKMGRPVSFEEGKRAGN